MDASTGAWHDDSILYVHRDGVMTGMSDTVFSPDTNLTRTQIATIMLRYLSA